MMTNSGLDSDGELSGEENKNDPKMPLFVIQKKDENGLSMSDNPEENLAEMDENIDQNTEEQDTFNSQVFVQEEFDLAKSHEQIVCRLDLFDEFEFFGEAFKFSRQ